MRVACVIPARLASTRFPRKILAPLGGKPLIQWVWEAALETECFDSVTVAVDSEEVFELVTGFGAKAQMTDPQCSSGTARVLALDLEADVVVNWQGDEPFLHKAMIRDLLQSCPDGADVWTLKKRITDERDIVNPHIAKVVTDAQGCALYFSRSPIPFYRDQTAGAVYFKHVGLYAYSRAGMDKLRALVPCALEEAEKLEQLSFLFHGLKVQVHETHHEAFGIDLPEHLALAEMRVQSGAALAFSSG